MLSRTFTHQWISDPIFGPDYLFSWSTKPDKSNCSRSTVVNHCFIYSVKGTEKVLHARQLLNSFCKKLNTAKPLPFWFRSNNEKYMKKYFLLNCKNLVFFLHFSYLVNEKCKESIWRINMNLYYNIWMKTSTPKKEYRVETKYFTCVKYFL